MRWRHPHALMFEIDTFVRWKYDLFFLFASASFPRAMKVVRIPESLVVRYFEVGVLAKANFDC